MRGNRFLLVVLALPIIIVFMAYKNGSPGGYSSSAGDKGLTCVSCHSGSPQNVSGWIKTNIPATGYVSGGVYVISLSASAPNAVMFGFELSAEDSNNKKIATFSITNSTDTKLIAGKGVTHTLAGTTPYRNSRIWEFEWTAPEENTGSITFSASVNAANGNGYNSGDVIYRTSTMVSSRTNSIKENKNVLKFYPNPTSGIVNFEAISQPGKTDVLIFNNKGQQVENFVINNGLHTIDLTHLPKGMYFLNLTNENTTEMKKLILY